MKFRVEKQGDQYVILDEPGTVYGRYDKRAEADEALAGWEAYYGDKV